VAIVPAGDGAVVRAEEESANVPVG